MGKLRASEVEIEAFQVEIRSSTRQAAPPPAGFALPDLPPETAAAAGAAAQTLLTSEVLGNFKEMLAKSPRAAPAAPSAPGAAAGLAGTEGGINLVAPMDTDMDELDSERMHRLLAAAREGSAEHEGDFVRLIEEMGAKVKTWTPRASHIGAPPLFSWAPRATAAPRAQEWPG